MAVADLHNVSAFGPFFSESQCWDSERNRPSTHSSSVLQMCRELEGEHVISPSHRSRQQRNASNPESVSIEQESDNNGCSNISEDANDTEANHVVTSSEMEHDDNNNVLSESEQSSDLGESGRERVRQIFREWRNSGALAHSSNGLNNRSGPQWLGENECERVRVVREWVQMSAEHKSNSDPRSPRSEVSETDSQIELVRDGLAINNHQENGVRKPIRKLCGRQTLIDLLMRAQRERKGELRFLSEQKPVSEFSHRNRIQALLRGRFLRNERLIEDNRHSSVAATELDFLRQRQTVSDLREEFLAKLENTPSASSNNAESDSSSSHENNNESMPLCTERNIDSENNTPDSVQVERDRTQHDDPVLPVTQENEQEATFAHSIDHQVIEVEDQSHQNEEIELEFSLPHERVDQLSINVESGSSRDEQVSDNEASDQEHSIHVEHADYGSRQRTDADIVDSSSLQTDNSIELPERSIDSQDITNQESDQQGTSSQLQVFQDSEIEIQDGSWQQQTTFFSTEWTDHRREEGEDERDFTRNWYETFANQWFQETSETNNASLNHDNDDEDHAQEPHEDDWPSHDLQEAIDSWLHRPSSIDVGVSLGRFHYDYFPDDENAQSMEISELSSRRRVSSLLRSSFRDSLDQVLQSHVRQVQSSSIDSEGESSSSHVLIGQGEEQLNVDQSLTTTLSDDVEANQFDQTLTNVTESNPLWDDESTRNSLLHANLNQLLGTEWEVINGLRIDMARLQQRMNTMQSMLEAFIDMQIELQLCVRQEVSAALNRTVLTRDTDTEKATDNESQWEHVRKGVCCLCGESKINSLLYRCGHMCTCCECAKKLVRDNGKCPMCRAPIVEAVRAYFIQ